MDPGPNRNEPAAITAVKAGVYWFVTQVWPKFLALPIFAKILFFVFFGIYELLGFWIPTPLDEAIAAYLLLELLYALFVGVNVPRA